MYVRVRTILTHWYVTGNGRPRAPFSFFPVATRRDASDVATAKINFLVQSARRGRSYLGQSVSQSSPTHPPTKTTTKAQQMKYFQLSAYKNIIQKISGRLSMY